jgi:hypothetical protein
MTGPEICDRLGCGAERGTANGWWVVMMILNAWAIAPYRAGSNYGTQDRKVCGEACAHLLLSEYLNQEKKRHVSESAG